MNCEFRVWLDQYTVQQVNAAGGDIEKMVQNMIEREVNRWLSRHYYRRTEHERRSKAAMKGLETKRRRLAALSPAAPTQRD